MLLKKLFETVIHRYYPEPEENGRFIAQRLKELSEDVSQSAANATSDPEIRTIIDSPRPRDLRISG